MAEPYINSMALLKQYILRKLGAPVINIEITDEQLTDCIKDTLDDYIPRAYSGTNLTYIPMQLIEGVHEYILPYDIFAVLGVNGSETIGMGIGSQTASNLFSINQFIAADLYKPGVAKIDMINYEMLNEMISTLNLLFSKKITFDFNSISKILRIHNESTDDPKVILEVYRKINLERTPVSAGAANYHEENIFNEPPIKRIATARARKQWSLNLIKYAGTTLPNGGTLNAEKLLDIAEKELEYELQILEDRYTLPTDFFIG